MMNIPPELSALALVMLMKQQDVHHFVIDLTDLDSEESRGLSLDFSIEPEKIEVYTGRCQCAACLAKTGGQQ